MAERNYHPMNVRGDDRFTHIAEKAVGSPSYSFDLKRGAGVGQYFVQWDRNNLKIPEGVADFLGYSFPAPEKVDTRWFISRHIPFEHPSFKEHLYAEAIQKIEGDTPARFGDSRDFNRVNQFQEALFTVNFGTRPYPILTDQEMKTIGGTNYPDESKLLRYVSVQVIPSGRTERIPSLTALKWVLPPLTNGLPTPMSNTGTVNILGGNVIMRYHQVPLSMIPWKAIFYCMGKTNSAALGTLNVFPYFAAQTLVLLVPKIGDPYSMANGVLACDIDLPFLWSPYGSNNFYRWDGADGPGYEPATRSGVPLDESAYKTAPMDALFWGPSQNDF